MAGEARRQAGGELGRRAEFRELVYRLPSEAGSDPGGAAERMGTTPSAIARMEDGGGLAALVRVNRPRSSVQSCPFVRSTMSQGSVAPGHRERPPASEGPRPTHVRGPPGAATARAAASGSTPLPKVQGLADEGEAHPLLFEPHGFAVAVFDQVAVEAGLFYGQMGQVA